MLLDQLSKQFDLVYTQLTLHHCDDPSLMVNVLVY